MAQSHYYDFLDDLRDSGTTNMFGAVPYLRAYDPKLTKIQAEAILFAWMESK